MSSGPDQPDARRARSGPRPPGLDPSFAAAFQDEDVVALYYLRPAYPQAVIDRLVELALAGARVLEIGPGTGEIARRMAPHVEAVDAIDMSTEMLAEACRLPGGEAQNIRWVPGRLEDVRLDRPVGLAVAGDSLHWMDWDVVLPKLATVVAPNGFLAIVTRDWGLGTDEERDIYQRFSVNPRFVGFDLIAELTERGLFRQAGKEEYSTSWRPTIEEYIDGRHSQSGFRRSGMGTDRAAEFDRELRGLIDRQLADGSLSTSQGRLELAMTASVVWGTPLGSSGRPSVSDARS